MKGIIDEVALFNEALSQTQIKQAMDGIKLASVDKKDKLSKA